MQNNNNYNTNANTDKPAKHSPSPCPAGRPFVRRASTLLLRPAHEPTKTRSSHFSVRSLANKPAPASYVSAGSHNNEHWCARLATVWPSAPVLWFRRRRASCCGACISYRLTVGVGVDVDAEEEQLLPGSWTTRFEDGNRERARDAGQICSFKGQTLSRRPIKRARRSESWPEQRKSRRR